MRIITCFFILFLFGCARTPIPGTPPSTLPWSSTKFHGVDPERWTLDNGLKVIFYQDRELPLVEGKLFIKGGSFWEGMHERGIVRATGALMRQGGAGALAADQLDETLAKLSAGIDSDFGGESGAVSFRALSSDFNQVFSLFSDVALRPRFEESRLNVWKGQMLESIQRRIDEPETVASYAFSQLIYGPTRYGQALLSSDVQKITRSKMLSAHAKYFKAPGAILVIVGDVGLEQVKERVQAEFGSWNNRGEVLPPLPLAEHQATPGIYFIELPFTQATILMGHLGPTRFTPDYIAIDVFNEIFGSGDFSSRLMRRIRTELGLAYSIFGGTSPEIMRGKDYVMLQTKSESADQAMGEVIDTIVRLKGELVESWELDETKDSVEHSYVFNFSSPAQTLVRLASLEILDFPEDYDKMYVERVRAVNQSDIQEVARRHWHPQNFVIVVVGNEVAYNAAKRFQNSGKLGNIPLYKARFDEKLIM